MTQIVAKNPSIPAVGCIQSTRNGSRYCTTPYLTPTSADHPKGHLGSMHRRVWLELHQHSDSHPSLRSQFDLGRCADAGISTPEQTTQCRFHRRFVRPLPRAGNWLDRRQADSRAPAPRLDTEKKATHPTLLIWFGHTQPDLRPRDNFAGRPVPHRAHTNALPRYPRRVTAQEGHIWSAQPCPCGSLLEEIPVDPTTPAIPNTGNSACPLRCRGDAHRAPSRHVRISIISECYVPDARQPRVPDRHRSGA